MLTAPRFFRRAAVVLFLLASAACAGDPGDAETEDALAAGEDGTCDAHCVIALVKELVPVKRVSGEEKALRDLLVGKAERANDAHWQGRLTISAPDAAGNFLIRVPATDEFANATNLPALALHAHMDMALASSEVELGADPKPYFRAHSVTLEEKDGWLQAASGKTNIGADSAVGCALMMRYALDPSIAHPALELLFTAEKENGRRGARELDTSALSLSAPVMLSLDADSESSAYTGVEGSFRTSLSGPVPTRSMAAGRTMSVKIALNGGYLPATTHLPRLAKALVDGMPVGIVGGVSANRFQLDYAGTEFELKVAVPATMDAPAFEAGVRAAMADVLRPWGSSYEYGLAIAPVREGETTVRVIEPESLEALKASMASANDHHGYGHTPPQLFESWAIAYLELAAGPSSDAPVTMSMNLNVRSEKPELIAGYSRAAVEELKSKFPNPAAVTVESRGEYLGWMLKNRAHSWFVQHMFWLRGEDDKMIGFVGGTTTKVLEAGDLEAKFPSMQIIAVGPTTRASGRVGEALEIASVRNFVPRIDHAIATITKRPEFRR